MVTVVLTLIIFLIPILNIQPELIGLIQLLKLILSSFMHEMLFVWYTKDVNKDKLLTPFFIIL